MQTIEKPIARSDSIREIEAGLFTKITYLPEEQIRFVNDALEFTKKSHAGQLRRSGELYITHPIATACYLADMKLDSATIAAALLHDVVEDCDVETEDLEKRYGPDVAMLVEGVTKLSKITGEKESTDSRRNASLRKVLVATARDVRVILIKLADRLHNMTTLQHMSAHKREIIARETLNLYAPLADRLGVSNMKWQLEDEAFKHLMPNGYKRISNLINRKRTEREQFTSRIIARLREILQEEGVNCTVTGRPKHLYSTHRKYERYKKMGRAFDDIHDLIAVRIITTNIDECYRALGVVHNTWHQFPGSFDDYIGNPKENNYRSLHTSVRWNNSRPFEVQIRTEAMHKIAEEGVAAHWAYKQNKTPEKWDNLFEDRPKWLHNLLTWLRYLQTEAAGDDEYISSVQADLLSDRVFIYTPKGDVVDLPSGSTPLDFAYSVHTELGHHCIGVLVNGKITSLNTPLRNGDTVEVRKSNTNRGPSLDWLNPDLGYLVSTSAKYKVRAWFKKQRRPDNIQRGSTYIHREIRRLGMDMAIEDIAKLMGFEKTDYFAESIGSGRLSVDSVVSKLTETVLPKTSPEPNHKQKSEKDSGLVVMGEKNMLTYIPKCCNPSYGEEIIGYITQGKGVSVHNSSCSNLRSLKNLDRLVQVAWGHTDTRHPVRISISGKDKLGLIRDIAQVIYDELLNIHSLISDEKTEKSDAYIQLTVYPQEMSHLSRLLNRLQQISGVNSVKLIDQH